MRHPKRQVDQASDHAAIYADVDVSSLPGSKPTIAATCSVADSAAFELFAGGSLG